ncbi:MAG: peroxide stress protein YaaA [Thalassolituus sp.]|jgi:cytoplasmic iron level regulating protein YaaA (DUF328/UPF0246 family)|nr:peroxide stress protein YaaA [Pseudomonadota bacterium]MEC8102842.1 peroxide stress protein YaaA [Pseudomonadota bacterium]MEC8525252.1 peroxide stress protein YaaA [Pseudomonadota bacterium]MEE2748958.1 peroxide stress protein YaaA [Pseudomonadota bacterium]TNC85383.1 MAG: peroxide stress protein YaaA [Thalassolituus sp.]|tara:strand:- start:277 stop:1065 length:789 start_codon:yes stop_codon:yes gene_type:complete
MLTLLSPAKTLDFDTPPVTDQHSTPDYLDDSAELIDVLRKYSPDDIAGLMKLSPKLAELNVQRYSDWQLPFPDGQAKAAVLAFKGDVYTGLDADSMSKQDLDYAQGHLRILSGLYGLLRPLDLILPYRLEMGTRLDNDRGKDLYAFWGDKITDALNELTRESGITTIVNLASNEYFKSVKKKQLEAELITPVFKDEKNGKYKIISFYAKKARGLMAAYQITERIEDAQALKDFDVAGYRFSEEESSDTEWVFKRAEKDIPNA